MSKYQRGGRWTVRVPHPLTGVSFEKATGTRDSGIAARYETMCAVLADRPADHLFLIAVCERRLDLRALYAHWSQGRLALLRASVEDVDLTEHLADWRASLVSRYGEPEGALGCSSHTVTQYTRQVGRFFEWAGAVPLLSHYSVELAGRWLNRQAVTSARKRRYWAALRSFGTHLRAVGVLPRDAEPLAGLGAPPAGRARDRHLNEEERDRLIAASAGHFKTAEVLAHLGMELGAVLAARVRDLDFATRMVRIRGTKNRFRDRDGVMPAWALPFLRDACKGKLPDARLVPSSGSKVRAEHVAACQAVGIAGYRFHDARHTFAVEWWSKGVPSSVIGLQLGHADGKTVEKVYGQHRATGQQLRHWADVVESATKPATSKEAHGL